MLVLVTLLAAWGWLFSKEVLAWVTPLAFIAGRFLLSGAILFSFSFEEVSRLSRADLARAATTGVILGVQTLIWALALKLSDQMGVGAFLISLGFVATPFVGALLFGLQLGPKAITSLTTACVGLAFLLLSGQSSLSVSDGLFGLSALVYAVYLNVNFLNAKRLAVFPNTCVQMLSAGLVNLAAYGLWHQGQVTLTLGVVGWFLASVLLATVLRFLLLVKAHSYPKGKQGAVIMTLEPVWVALLGAFWFGEQMTPTQILGCTLIFIALMISVRETLKPPLKPKSLNDT